MNYTYNYEFNAITNDILENKEFEKIKYIEHHGTTRYDHSLRVAYYSYLVAKNLKFDYISTARAGLLHDFFINENRSKKGRFISTFVHPKKALETSINNFELSNLEKNIIESHMFPLYTKLPIYKESWLVSIIDKLVAVYEFSLGFKVRFRHVSNLYILILFSIFK